MRSTLFFFLLFVSIQGFCQSKTIQIHVGTSTPDGGVKDSTYLLTANFFEITLYSTTKDNGSKYFTASSKLSNDQSISIWEAGKKEAKKFNGLADFLDFMLSGGYEVATETKSKYRIEYMFKKKK